jgi:hypothetical protein
MPTWATYVATSLFTGALVLGACQLVLPVSKTNGEDWVQDYLSARALLRGEDPYQDLPAMRRAAGIPSTATDPVPVNPHPPGAFLWLLPLGAMDYPASFLTLRVLNGLALGFAWNGAWVVFARPGGRAWWGLAAAGGAFGFWGPVYQGFDFGQPSGLLALAALGLWVALRGGGPFRHGLALGLACSVRPFFFILSAAGMTGGPRRIGTSAAGFVLGFGFPFLVVGTTPWGWWLESASHSGGYTHLMGTLPGILGLRTGPAVGLYLAAWAALIGIRQRRGPDDVVALGLAAVLWVYPLAWYHYDTIFVAGVVWILAEADRRAGRAAVWLLVGYLLLRTPPSVLEAFQERKAMQFVGRTLLVAGLVWLTLRGRRPNPRGPAEGMGHE